MIKKERHVLIILPHPDDEAFGISGSISAYRKMDVPVTYACLTLGEMGRNLGNPPFANRETLPQIRKAELEKACAAMGLMIYDSWDSVIKRLNLKTTKKW